MDDPRGRADNAVVWDLPVRLFHWALVLLVIAQITTATIGGNAMQWHARGGYAILTLVLFRVAWGVFGGTHARFRDFVRGPGAVVRYARSLLRTPPSPHRGHNPLGGWSVLAMLGSLLVQAVSGLFANDDVMMEGPLAKYVSARASEIATLVHEINSAVLLSLIALHVLAVLFYLIGRKDNLIVPMITGRGRLADPDAVGREGNAWLAALLLGGIAAAVYFVVTI